MKRRSANSVAAFMLAVATFLGSGTILGQQPGPLARDQDSPELPAKDSENTTRLTVQVLDESKKPIYNAHVVIRFEVDRKLRRDKQVSWESKANQNGEVVLNGIPRGMIKIQVIARGFQTYGDQHELTEREQTIAIAMKAPSGQKSAY